ncbi:MAG TPA: S53 family peptidase [Microbacterium sp.]|uniref:S53 family peptidase n=1 Tax=Microbacterium sp. TaxID=51671 RepID=UPI002B47C802|nr:S53 family peptidase [Microbacterium sp.]HKT56744.1 S53 family peptidase [Microbacterium sp.]
MAEHQGRRSRKRLTVFIATGACAVAMALTGSGAASAATAPATVRFPGSVPAWATHANDAGAPATDTTVEGELYLELRDPAGAAALAKAVSDPMSRQYRHALSPAQWIARYAPAQSTYTQVVRYLTSKGLTITGTPASREYVVFRGSADQVNAVFATRLHRYRHDGRSLIAPSSAPVLPSGIGRSVLAVGVDQSRALTRPDSIDRDKDQGGKTRAVQRTMQQRAASPRTPATPADVSAPCSTYWAQNQAILPAAYGTTSFNTNICGYVPAQLRSAYGLSKLEAAGLQGQGQTIAITDAYASPSILQDVDGYSAQNGEPAMTSDQLSQIVAPTMYDEAACGYPSGWQGEETLDVESVHAIAPKAHILYLGAMNCGGGLDIALSTVLDNRLANIVSNSWGDVGEDVPADVIAGEQNLHIQAAGEGIGLYFSSGDNGDETGNLGYASPDFPASSPWVTAVGGTSLGIAQNGGIAVESGWGSTLDKVAKDDQTGALSYLSPLPGDFGGGAGGGVSAVNPQPWYQRGVVPGSLARGMRVSPDVAALADPYTGFEIGISPITDDAALTTGAYQNETYGGTSLAAPLTAAMMALSQQLTHSVIGFANPTLYAIDRIAPQAFRDVRPAQGGLAYTSAHSGNTYLVSYDTDTSLTTARGYDDVTGMGAINFALAQRTGHGH